MDERVRQFVRDRSKDRCEYCRIPQRHFVQTFHIEHIVALSHGGEDSSENAAVACRRCNLHKGPNLSGLDPLTGGLTRLFHPRQDLWADHFEQEESGQILGRTPIGRTTVEVLAMNAERRVELRRAIHSLELPE